MEPSLHYKVTRGRKKEERRDMKLVWSPETASKAYVGTVKLVSFKILVFPEEIHTLLWKPLG